MSLFDYRPGELSLLLNPTAPPDVYVPPPQSASHSKRYRDSSAAQHDRPSKKQKAPAASARSHAALAAARAAALQHRGRPQLEQDDGEGGAGAGDAGEGDEDDEQRPAADDADAEAELSDLSDVDDSGLYDDVDAATARQLRREKRLLEDERAESEPVSSSRRRLSSSQPPAADPRLPRTLFVGNVSVSCTRKALCRVFSEYGRIESCRFRSFAADNPKLSKKVAVIRRAFHPQRQTLNAYIVYEQEDSVTKALAANGSLLLEHRLRVDYADRSRQRHAEAASSPASRRSVFVGNLPFSASEEQLQSLFSSAGAVSDVRLVRDAQLSLGKGFGFVLYEDEQSVRRALAMKGVRLDGRELRVSRAMDEDRLRQLKEQRRREAQQQQQSLRGAARRVMGKEKHAQRRLQQQQRLSAPAASSPSLPAPPAAPRRRVVGAVSDPQQFVSQQRRLAKKQKVRKEERKQKRSLVRTKKPRRRDTQAAGDVKETATVKEKATVKQARAGSSSSRTAQ